MKILACFVLIFVCRLAERSSAVDLASGHSFFAALDEDQKMKLYWNVDTAKKELSFTVEAQTTGWIGFGISSGQGKMEGADIVIGWVKDGKPYFKVYFPRGIKITGPQCLQSATKLVETLRLNSTFNVSNNTSICTTI